MSPKQAAYDMCCLFRYLPLVSQAFVESDNEHYMLLLKLLRIVYITLATLITNTMLCRGEQDFL